jgi:uncharacterized protein
MRSRWSVIVTLGMLGVAPPAAVRAGEAPAAAALLQAAQAAVDRGDEASAFSLLRRLAIADDPEGQYRLGLLLERPRSGAQPDPHGAAYWYERAAERGHAGAARRLGDLYASGRIGSFQSGGREAPELAEAVRWYATAATGGDAEARGALEGLRARSALAEALLARASGDYAPARAKLEPLAKRLDLEALYWRGVMQESGEGGSPDAAGAVRWYEQAYQLGYGPAALALGRLYETGRGVPRDIDQAYRMYGAAEASGESEAAAAIGRLGLARKGGPVPAGLEGALRAYQAREYVTSAAMLRPLAVAGDADAQYWLATLYTGDLPTGDPRSATVTNRDEAIRWFRAAALQGDAESAYQLAQLLAPDRSVDAAGRSLGDATEQVRWLKAAAEAGHKDAAMELGSAYREGRGVAADQAETDRWYKRAHKAEAGWARLSRPACVEDPGAPELLPAFLACNRNDGDGLAEALLPLAEAGNARAEAWVAYLMEAGAGTGGGYDLRAQPNPQRAARWYAKAAAQGLPSAMYDYGVILEHGMGVPVDETAAKQWYARAAGRSLRGAEEALAGVGTTQP